MSLNTALLEVIADPHDKLPLIWNAADALLYNPRLNRAYRLNAGFPVLLAAEAIAVDAAAAQRPRSDGSAAVIQDASIANIPRPISQFEGHADWYEKVMSDPSDRGSLLGAAIAELIKLVGRGSGVALDVGCGTGIVASALREQGYQPLGVDLSEDQLRFAVDRLPVVQGNAAELPFVSGSIPLAYSTFTSSAWELQAQSIKEVFRVLKSGGHYVDVGVHPCFNGGYAEPQTDGSIVQKPGYRTRGFRDPSNFKGTVRGRVGAWHRPLADVINAFLDAGFHIKEIVEGGPDTIPKILGIRAVKP